MDHAGIASEDVPRYKYSPLHGNEVRLLELYPGKFDDDLKLRIFHQPLVVPEEDSAVQAKRTRREVEATLPEGWEAYRTPEGRWFYWDLHSRRRTYKYPAYGNFPPSVAEDAVPSQDRRFEALSYTWGDAARLQIHTVKVAEDFGNRNDHWRYLPIGESLDTALRYLRLKTTARTLWIDAICINQKDILERAAQVQRMRQIYGHASQVVVWLGPTSDNSQEALSTLAYLGQQIEISEDGRFCSTPDGKAGQPTWWKPEARLPYSEYQWAAIEDLFARSWFSRLWVLQEVVANTRTEFLCGSQTIEWRLLRRAIAALTGRRGVPVNLAADVNVKSNIAYGQIRLLRDALYLSREHSCEDPRDRIFGLLGMLGPELRLAITPSYERAFQDVYRDVFWAYSTITGRLDLLTSCVDDDESGLPSWVPDWRQPPGRYRTLGHGYQASGISRSYFHAEGKDTLVCTGVWHDEVIKVFNPADDTPESLVSKLREIQPADLEDTRYMTGEDLTSAWIRTLAMDFLDERMFHMGFVRYEDFKTYVLQLLGTKSEDDISAILQNFGPMLRDTLLHMCFFHTTSGYFGFGPSSMIPNDRICILLGVPNPLVVRRNSEGHHRIIGWAYVHGLMDGEALLGALPQGWHVEQHFKDRRSFPQYFNDWSEYRFRDDPRLGSIPDEWERIDREATRDDPIVVGFFRNKSTGEVIIYDPRMTREKLEERGVKLEEIRFK